MSSRAVVTGAQRGASHGTASGLTGLSSGPTALAAQIIDFERFCGSASSAI